MDEMNELIGDIEGSMIQCSEQFCFPYARNKEGEQKNYDHVDIENTINFYEIQKLQQLKKRENWRKRKASNQLNLFQKRSSSKYVTMSRSERIALKKQKEKQQRLEKQRMGVDNLPRIDEKGQLIEGDAGMRLPNVQNIKVLQEMNVPMKVNGIPISVNLKHEAQKLKHILHLQKQMEHHISQNNNQITPQMLYLQQQLQKQGSQIQIEQPKLEYIQAALRGHQIRQRRGIRRRDLHHSHPQHHHQHQHQHQQQIRRPRQPMISDQQRQQQQQQQLRQFQQIQEMERVRETQNQNQQDDEEMEEKEQDNNVIEISDSD